MKLSEVIHFYIGQKLIHTDDYLVENEFTLTGQFVDRWNENCRLLLRPLSSMTEEEAVSFFSIKDPEILKYEIKSYSLTEEQQKIRFGYNGSYMSIWRMGFNFTPTEFLFLLSKSFDIFGLISSEQAIDITKLNK